MRNWRETLRLPESPVPMRANLPTLEPRLLGEWEALDLYARLRRRRAGAPRFLLHDGPPYANGELHMGHALNKSLKDIIIRFKALSGFDTPFVPGWDCHGLPIEHNVGKSLGQQAEALSQIEIRAKCREYAANFVGIQREGFKRLGCIGLWENPYLTMDPLFTARIIEAFRRIHARGFVYRGLKPIHWCPSCRTALAASTAEAEYGMHTSDAITVAFPSVDAGEPAILIWTTTPWTLPANLALAVRPDLDYVTVRIGARRFLLSEALLARTALECGWSETPVEAKMSGKELEGRRFRHPFLERVVPVILADHVTTEQGTGIVHIAPGHGLEDYTAGLQYNLEILAPVDERGRLTPEAGVSVGKTVFEANPEIIALLKERDALIHSVKVEHQYPHCWRCKGPVIFRATRQWFMAVDHGAPPLRRLALEKAETVRWIPTWGRDRFVGSVKERPDWCLSRQRAWGVPIPALVCDACDEAIIDDATRDEAMALARAGRLDDWFTTPPDRACPKCAGALRRETDILDVWFDSGVSWFATEMEHGGSRKDGEPPVADLYLEGSDQHRGWFQSSLWPSLALRGEPPYRAVLTHGFMLDGEGKAMHKSAGNAIAPDEILKKHGADVIRLWVASENYREDVRLSHKILDQVADTYRKFRNTWRFLAANVVDLPVEVDLPIEERDELDRWILARLGLTIERARKGYEEYSFHDVHRAMLELATNDLSSLYLDIIKDRLYCDAPEGRSRRAAQITCREILAATLRIMAPILPFTCDEIWKLAAVRKDGDAADSIHLADWPEAPPSDRKLLDRYELHLPARAEILKAIEEKRAAGVIKSSQMAEVRGPFKGDLALLKSLCQVAAVGLGETLEVTATTLPKCPRCWRHLELAGEICRRCGEVVAALGVGREA